MEFFLGLLIVALIIMILGAALFLGGIGGGFMGLFYAFKSYFVAIKENISNIFIKVLCYMILIGSIALPIVGIILASVLS